MRQLPRSVFLWMCTHTAAESLLSVTLPTAIRETQCSLWGFTPPGVNVCVCECERGLGREKQFNGLNSRSLSTVKVRRGREGGIVTEKNVNISCTKGTVVTNFSNVHRNFFC